MSPSSLAAYVALRKSMLRWKKTEFLVDLVLYNVNSTHIMNLSHTHPHMNPPPPPLGESESKKIGFVPPFGVSSEIQKTAEYYLQPIS